MIKTVTNYKLLRNVITVKIQQNLVVDVNLLGVNYSFSHFKKD